MREHLLDTLLGLPSPDWIAGYKQMFDDAHAKAIAALHDNHAATHPERGPSLPLSGYAGTYRDAWYGDVSVEQKGGKLRLRFGATADLQGTMEHWQHDTFIVRWDNRSLNADAFVNFSLDPDGKVREVRMQAVSSLTDFSFDFQDLLLQPTAQ